MPLPVNFSTKLKEAKAPDGKGYPFAIKAEDLMKDFVYASLIVDETPHASGLYLHELKTFGEDGHTAREIRIEGTVNGLPEGTSGDIIRHDGTGWVTVNTEWLEVYVCVDGSPVLKSILALIP